MAFVFVFVSGVRISAGVGVALPGESESESEAEGSEGHEHIVVFRVEKSKWQWKLRRAAFFDVRLFFVNVICGGTGFKTVSGSGALIRALDAVRARSWKEEALRAERVEYQSTVWF